MFDLPQGDLPRVAALDLRGQRYTKLVYFNELDKGGHFAAFEQPEMFVRELRACFRQVRQAAR